MSKAFVRDERQKLGTELEYRQVKDASITGVGVGAVTLLIRGCVDFVSVVVLARLLTPADFGLVAMASVILYVLRIVGDWGLVMASTQQARILVAQISTLFWINVSVGIVLAIISIVSSPILVEIFDEPRIFGVTAALSVTLVVIGIGAQHEAVIRRTMKFGVLHTVDVFSQALGLAVGIFAAVLGFGVWSLVAYQVTARVVRTVGLWLGSGWSPEKPGRVVDVKHIIQYGQRLVPVQILAHASRSIAEIVVGATAGATDLGLYRRAHGTLMIVEQLKQPLKAMMPASLSRLQTQSSEYRLFYLNSLTLWCFVAIPAVGYLVAEAPFVIYVLLGDQWLGAVPYVRMLGGVGLATAVGAATEWLLLPLADLQRLITLRVVRACSIIVGILVGWRWGVAGIAVGYSVSACVSFVVEMALATRGRSLPRGGLLLAFARPTVAATAASIVVLLIRDDLSFAVNIAELLLYPVVFVFVHSCFPGGWVVTRRAFRTVLLAGQRLVRRAGGALDTGRARP